MNDIRTWSNKRNPLLPLDIHIPDAEGHVMPDGKLYLYGSFDEKEDVYCSDRYHVVSTPDMLHWTIHDTSLSGEQIPWFSDPNAPKYPGIDWSHPTPFIRKMLEETKAKEGTDMKEKFEKKKDAAPEPLLFAPDCLAHGGKYYLYFCMADDSEGVAVSDHPEGPFHDPVRLPIGGIDPAVFKDRDGSVYYYWGQLFSHGVKLNPDLVSFDPNAVVSDLVTEETHYFHEGSSMRRIGDTYYYVYADMQRGKPTALGYATSDSPLGPFTYRGIIIDNAACDPKSWNNHGSIECVNGQWYVFYHRSSGNAQVHRRLCAEKIEILPDGTIPEVLPTSQGVGDPFAPGEKIFGYEACALEGSVYIGAAPGEDYFKPHREYLQGIAPGDQVTFRYVKSDRPWTGIRIEGQGSGRIEVLLGKTLAGELEIRDGQGEGALQAPAGTCPLTLRVLSCENLVIDSLCLFAD